MRKDRFENERRIKNLKSKIFLFVIMLWMANYSSRWSQREIPGIRLTFLATVYINKIEK